MANNKSTSLESVKSSVSKAINADPRVNHSISGNVSCSSKLPCNSQPENPTKDGVVLACRPVLGKWVNETFATHCYVEINLDGKRHTASGGFTDNSSTKIKVVTNSGDDYCKPELADYRKEIPTPSDMTPTEHAKKTLDSALEMEKNVPPVKYDFLSRSSTNSNDKAREIIEGGGGEIPFDTDPPRFAPGLDVKSERNRILFPYFPENDFT